MTPLGKLCAGERAEVMNTRVGNECHRKKSSAEDSRIEELGLRAGKIVEMLNNRGRGSLLIKVDESRIGIGRGMAMNIMVRRLGQ